MYQEFCEKYLSDLCFAWSNALSYWHGAHKKTKKYVSWKPITSIDFADYLSFQPREKEKRNDRYNCHIFTGTTNVPWLPKKGSTCPNIYKKQRTQNKNGFPCDIRWNITQKGERCIHHVCGQIVLERFITRNTRYMQNLGKSIARKNHRYIEIEYVICIPTDNVMEMIPTLLRVTYNENVHFRKMKLNVVENGSPVNDQKWYTSSSYCPFLVGKRDLFLFIYLKLCNL